MRSGSSGQVKSGDTLKGQVRAVIPLAIAGWAWI